MLTDTAVRNAKPGINARGEPTAKPYKMGDSGGMYLEVAPSGGKWWRLKYRMDGRERRLSLGTYPETGLADARAKRDAARKLLADGVDPSEVRRAEQSATAASFEAVAREWHAKFAGQWEPKHARTIMRRLERDVFAWLGAKPVVGITAADVLPVLARIDKRGARETAHRVRTIIGQVMRYAVATGRAEHDPAAALRGAIPAAKVRHLSAVTEPAQVAELLRAVHDYKGSFVTRCALRLAPLVFVRPGELRNAEWADVDLDAGAWRFEASKTHVEHLVPLATQAVAILRELQPLTGAGRYLFPGFRSIKRPISDNTLRSALRSLGFDNNTMTVHGFRAMARTLLDERLGFPPEHIEQQLAHTVRGSLGRAYNRTRYLDDRRKMMQTWADYLDALRTGSNVVAFKRKA